MLGRYAGAVQSYPRLSASLSTGGSLLCVMSYRPMVGSVTEIRLGNKKQQNTIVSYCGFKELWRVKMLNRP